MDVIVLIGRILLSLIFIGSGIGHFMQTEATAATAASRGLPSPRLMAQVSGAAMLLGGLGLTLGIWTDLAALGLALLLLVLGATMHPFWRDEGDRKQLEMAMFMKNLAMAGGAFALFGFFAYGYDALQVVGPALSLE